MPIQLPAAQVITTALGGSTIDTQDAVAAQQANIDLLSGTVQVTFTRGTPASNSFGISTRSAAVPFLTINAVTGAWSFNGQQGTLTAQQLSALQNNQRVFRNGIESLMNALGLIPGTVVQWT